jgi:hypothetical protein
MSYTRGFRRRNGPGVGFGPSLTMRYACGGTDSYAIGLWLLPTTAALTLLSTPTVVRRTARRHDEEMPHS